MTKNNTMSSPDEATDSHGMPWLPAGCAAEDGEGSVDVMHLGKRMGSSRDLTISSE